MRFLLPSPHLRGRQTGRPYAVSERRPARRDREALRPLSGVLFAGRGLEVARGVGEAKGEGMLSLFGARAGVAPRETAASLLPRLVDSSVAIDGRVLDVVRAGFLHGTMLVCRPVLDELQGLADAGDDLRRG